MPLNKARLSKLYPYLFILIILFCLPACSSKKAEENKITAYYDLKGLLDQQLLVLSKEKPQLQKGVFLDGERDSKLLQVDQKTWRNELDAFYNVDINKKDLVGQYHTKTGEEEGLKWLRYIASDPEKVAVNQLTIYYIDNPKLPSRIEIFTGKNNQLYSLQKSLELQFEGETSEDLRLTSYEIGASQKVVLQDSMQFEVKGQLRY